MSTSDLQPSFLKKAHLLMFRHSEARRSIIRTQSGFEQRSFSEHCIEVSDLLCRAGYGPRVMAASLLRYHPRGREQQQELWVEGEFDADVANLVFWIIDQNNHLPLEIRESMYLTKLRSAPHAALAVVCLSIVSNIRSVERLTKPEVEQDSLSYCGWKPFGTSLEHRIAYLQKLAEVFDQKLPETIFHPYLEKLEYLSTFQRWQRESPLTARFVPRPNPSVSSGLAPPMAVRAGRSY